ncbi:MAG: hypothetical protein GX977_09790 [Firmicutes bacterium]|nr:hypothetical protein [Bacillota bacterium]
MPRTLVHGAKLDPKRFAVPPRGLGILPFWFWNGDLRYEEMERQMHEYYDKGMPGFFIHSRFGLEVPYLSDEWFKRVRFACEKAKEIGLQAWVYDEKNWPSGTVGWKIPTEFPDLQQRYLEMVILHVDGPLFVYLEGTDSRYVDMQDSDPICAYAVRTDEFHGEIKEIIDLTPNLSFDKIVPWEAPAGSWELLYFIERRAKYYIDALNPESTEKFIQMTHERYKEEAGEYFGNVMPGFYTDEPALHYFETGVDNFIVPWSKRMFKLFRDRNGYDLKPYLPALFLDMGEMTSRIRLDFWQTVSEQYTKAFYKQIRDWCEANGVLFTGHLLYEDMLRLHSRNEGNIFDHLQQLHIVGVDHLYPRIGTRELPEQHVPHKIGSSAAHHFGSVRVLCESLGGTHWDVTMERMKWIADWEYVLGINLFNPHGFHYSIEGERKRDWPPSQFYHHTWWEHYKRFNDYVTRNGYMLSGGYHVAKVAMLYPINSMWANYVPQSHTPFSEVIENDFNYLADTLLRLHFDYDIIDEKVLSKGEVKDGKLHVADEAFELILLPPVTNLDEATLDKLEEFYEAGGKILGEAVLPTENLQGSEGKLGHRIEALFGIDPEVIRSTFLEGEVEPKRYINKNTAGGTAVFLQSSGLNQMDEPAWLDESIRLCISPDVEIDDDEVFYLHRVKDGKDIYFFVNPTDQARDVSCRLAKAGRPEHWVSETGEIQPLYVCEIGSDYTAFPLGLAPYGSALIVLQEDLPKIMITKANVPVESVTGKSVTVRARDVEDVELTVVKDGEMQMVKSPVDQVADPLELTGKWAFNLDRDNALLLNKWQVMVDHDNSGHNQGFYLPETDDSQWLTFTQGAWEMQLPEERDEKTYPVTLWYRAKFQCGYLPTDMRLLLDGMKGEKEIYVNGQKLELDSESQPSKLDAMMREIPIAKQLQLGWNVITIRLVVNARNDGIVDPLKLLGTFSLANSDAAGDYTVVAPIRQVAGASWTDQGYPFFSGTGSYEQVVEIDEDFLAGKVYLEVECADDLLTVLVNGKQAGVCMWHPYKVEVSQFLQPGENSITIQVTNSLINVLEGVKKPSGIQGKVRLVPYAVCKLELGR